MRSESPRPAIKILALRAQEQDNCQRNTMRSAPRRGLATRSARGRVGSGTKRGLGQRAARCGLRAGTPSTTPRCGGTRASWTRARSNPETVTEASHRVGYADEAGGNGSGIDSEPGVDAMRARASEAASRASGRQILVETLKSCLSSNAASIGLVALILCVVTTVILAQPLLSGAFFQTLVTPNPSTGRLRKVLLAMFATYMLEPICTLIYVSTMSRLTQSFVSDLQKKVFGMILAQNTAFFDLNDTTSLLSIVSSEINTITDVLGGNLSRDRGFRAIFEATGGVVILGLIAPKLAPVLLVFIAFTSVNAAVYSRKTKGLFVQKEVCKLRMNATATTAFTNIKTVRSFAAERFEFSNFLAMLKKADLVGLSLGKSKATLESRARFAIYSSLIMLYAFGGYLVTSGGMSIQSLIAGIGYTFSLVFATQGITNTFADVSKALVSFRKIEDFIDSLEPISTASEKVMMEDLALMSEARDDEDNEAGPPVGRETPVGAALTLAVDSFSYPTRPNTVALGEVQLELKSKKITALVGPSGAGKSTIVQLLSRFYKLQNGAMRLDGVDASKFSRKEWAKRISLVSQQPVLFPGTIRENIAYALEDEEATTSQVEAAAAAANAHDFISALPEGYDTDVGENGGRLSGGQRQRIAIARAFIRNTPILLLDEATSALDAESEKLVQSALESLYKDKAVLVIAHRLSTVVNADEIIVVEKGGILDRGTHAELLSRNALYQKLIGAQQICV